MHWRKRTGFSLVEMIVACGLLAVLMSVVGPSTVIATRLARQTTQNRRLIDELDNQLERLVVVPDDQIEFEIENLQLSESLAVLFPDATLQAERLMDDDGARLRITLNPGPSSGLRVMTMTGWKSPERGEEP